MKDQAVITEDGQANITELEHKRTPRLSFNFAKRYGVFVEADNDNHMVIAHTKALTPDTVVELQRYFDKPLMFNLINNEDQFPNLLASAYESGSDDAMDAIDSIEENMDLAQLVADMPSTQDLLESEDDAPVIRLLNAVLTQAIKQLVSDIHFETFEDKFIVRFRIDGVLHEVLSPPRMLAPLLVSRLKVMAKLDIAEKRLPQDGRISLRIAGRAVDVRVSTIPTHYGERIVLRLLDKQSAPLDLQKLGMPDKTLKLQRQLIAQPHGIILVTGPTGSGKTTTLYAALTELNQSVRNILTVEDPIEYYLEGIGQTQVNTKVGMTFAKGLRSILRQDPDVVMVGEIRDLETAEMAVQASLTGHLVLSTLHTNTAIGAVTRLRDMGVEPFLVSSTLIGVAAQRLVRKLCEKCKKPHEANQQELKLMRLKADDNVIIYKPVGCSHCGDGYHGRTGIYELIAIDDVMRNKIHSGASEQELEMYARQEHPSMRMDGVRRVLQGETTLEEVLRVTIENE